MQERIPGESMALGNKRLLYAKNFKLFCCTIEEIQLKGTINAYMQLVNWNEMDSNSDPSGSEVHGLPLFRIYHLPVTMNIPVSADPPAPSLLLSKMENLNWLLRFLTIKSSYHKWIILWLSVGI